jgi:sodium/bile acid cotransporter 7
MVVTKGLPDPPGRDGVQAKDRPREPSDGEEPPAKTPRTGCLGLILKVLKFIAEQWLVIGFGLACLFGYLWPGKRCPGPNCDNWGNVRRLMEITLVEVASKGGIIKSEYSVLYGSVGIIFFVSGLQLSPEKLCMNLFNWRLHIITQGISFILIPLIWLGMSSTSTSTSTAWPFFSQRASCRR